MKRLMVDELKKKLDQNESLQLVDIREQDEFELAHIAGSVNIPKKFIKDRFPEISKDVPAVIICRFGTKSAGIARILIDNGFENDSVYILDGGIYDWANEIDPSMPAHLL